jgi:hypothetical protein
MNLAGHAVHMQDTRNAYKDLVGKPQGKRPLGRSNHRWKDNINMYFRKTEWKGMAWFHLTQDRDQWWALVNTVMNLEVL